MHARNEGPGGCVPWEEHQALYTRWVEDDHALGEAQAAADDLAEAAQKLADWVRDYARRRDFQNYPAALIELEAILDKRLLVDTAVDMGRIDGP